MANNENIDIKLNIDGQSGLKSIRTMQLELRSMRDELMALETEANKAMQMGDEETANKAKAKHAERTKQFSELKNDIKDTQQAQKYLDPGELLGGYVKLAQGAVGAFGAITAGMKLMGSENEMINEITAKSATVIQFMMGLESARQMLIDAGGIKQIATLVKTTGLKITDIAVTSAQVVATGAATAAQWLLNIAMDANPIGLIIIGVTALIAGFYLLYEATGSLTEAMMWLVNPMGMLVGLLYDNYKASQLDNTEKEKSIAIAKEKVKATEKEIDAQNKVITSIEKKIDKMKAQGASEQELFNETLRLSNEKIKLANLEMKKATEQFDLSKKQGELSLVDYIRIENAKKGIIEETKSKQKLIDDANDKRISDARAKAEADYKKKIDDEKTYRLKMEDLQDDAIKNEFERNEAKITRAAQREIEALNKNAKNYTEMVNAILKKQEADLETNDKEREKSRIEAEFEIQNSVHSIMINGLNQELETIQDFNEKKRLIKEISSIEEANAIAEFEKANQKLKIVDAEAYEKGLLNIKTDFTNKTKDAIKKIDEEEIANIKDKSDKIKDIQDKIDSFKNPKLDIIKNIKDSANKEIEIEFEKWGKLAENKEKYDEWLILKNQETEDKITEAKQKRFEDELNQTTEITNEINELFNQASEQKLSKLEDQYSREQEALQNRLDKGLITQEQFDKQSEKLEIEKNNKIRVEKEKSWKRQHAVDIANAVANAAIAVAQVFAQEPGELITKTIASGIAAGIAAGQVALIASQQMPKFAKGGFVGGNLHSQGGTILEAEAGEFIVNRNAMSNPGFASIVQSINNSGIAPISWNISSNSSKNSMMVASVDSNAIAQAVIASITSIPVNVVESDITTIQKKVNTIESRSILG